MSKSSIFPTTDKGRPDKGSVAPATKPEAQPSAPTPAPGANQQHKRPAHSKRGPGRMGVVMVNWNRHAFTVECLETLLRSSIPLQVVVVDNASSDDSLAEISSWAAGSEGYTPPEGRMGAFSTPPLPKPVALTRFDAEGALATAPSPGSISLIDAGDNLGFAGGNNLGMRHLLRDPDIETIWLLNNDTIVEKDAAAEIQRMFRAHYRLGMCGTVVKYYFDPDTVQVLNGCRFSLLTGQGAPIGGGKPLSARLSSRVIADETDFVLGASLAVSRAFLSEIGLMSERYFLYFEEIDWATRNNNQQQEPFRIGFARGATIYHKEGGSIGSGGGKGKRSKMSDYYLLRARLLFYRQHYPLLYPLQWGLGMGQVLRRLLRWQPGKAGVLLRALLGRKFA